MKYPIQVREPCGSDSNVMIMLLHHRVYLASCMKDEWAESSIRHGNNKRLA